VKQITIRKAAQKALRRMPRNQRELIMSKIETYASDPASLANNVLKLTDRPGYRLRVGDWRIIFRESEMAIDVVVIGPRGSVYD
jgi:mRNA interferase RelE/StbE